MVLEILLTTTTFNNEGIMNESDYDYVGPSNEYHQ